MTVNPVENPAFAEINSVNFSGPPKKPKFESRVELFWENAAIFPV